MKASFFNGDEFLYDDKSCLDAAFLIWETSTSQSWKGKSLQEFFGKTKKRRIEVLQSFIPETEVDLFEVL